MRTHTHTPHLINIHNLLIHISNNVTAILNASSNDSGVYTAFRIQSLLYLRETGRYDGRYLNLLEKGKLQNLYTSVILHSVSSKPGIYWRPL